MIKQNIVSHLKEIHGVLSLWWKIKLSTTRPNKDFIVLRELLGVSEGACRANRASYEYLVFMHVRQYFLFRKNDPKVINLLLGGCQSSSNVVLNPFRDKRGYASKHPVNDDVNKWVFFQRLLASHDYTLLINEYMERNVINAVLNVHNYGKRLVFMQLKKEQDEIDRRVFFKDLEEVRHIFRNTVALQLDLNGFELDSLMEFPPDIVEERRVNADLLCDEVLTFDDYMTE